MTAVYVLYSIAEVLVFASVDALVRHLEERERIEPPVMMYADEAGRRGWRADLRRWEQNPEPSHQLQIATMKWRLFVTKCEVIQ